jgi:hypothetical protein
VLRVVQLSSLGGWQHVQHYIADSEQYLAVACAPRTDARPIVLKPIAGQYHCVTFSLPLHFFFLACADVRAVCMLQAEVSMRCSYVANSCYSTFTLE